MWLRVVPAALPGAAGAGAGGAVQGVYEDGSESAATASGVGAEERDQRCW